MTSNVLVYATINEMEDLFELDKNFSIRLYEGLNCVDLKIKFINLKLLFVTPIRLVIKTVKLLIMNLLLVHLKFEECLK